MALVASAGGPVWKVRPRNPIEREWATSRGRLIPFGQLPGVPVDTRFPSKVR